MTTPLDEISMKLGELTAYTHEHRHGVANLSAKMDGLSLDVSKQIATLKAEIHVRIDGTRDELQRRLSALEADQQRRAGVDATRAAFVRWWPVIVTFLAVVVVVLQAVGVIHLGGKS